MQTLDANICVLLNVNNSSPFLQLAEDLGARPVWVFNNGSPPTPANALFFVY